MQANFGVVVGDLPLTACDVTEATRAETFTVMESWGVALGGYTRSLGNPSAVVILNKFLAWSTG